MEEGIATKVDEHQLMELYLNSLLNNNVALHDDVSIETPSIVQNAIVDELGSSLQPTLKHMAEVGTNVSIKVLFFKLGQIMLATPMLGIYKILLLEDYKNRIAKVPGYSTCNQGLLTVRNKNFEIIDISNFILTTEQQEKFTLTLENSRYLLLISETAHAVMCQTVGQFKEIPLDVIKQRKKSHPYPWHIGTIVSDMVPIIDLTALIKAFLHKKC